jgi:hypothetical protein
MLILAVCALSAVAATACASDVTGPSTSTSFTGKFTGQMIVTTISGGFECSSTRTLDGSLTLTLQGPSLDTSVEGMGEVRGTVMEISVSPTTCPALTGNASLTQSHSLTGSMTKLTFFSSKTFSPPGVAGSVTCSDTVTFLGSLVENDITGTMIFTSSCMGHDAASTVTASGVTSIPVTLR